MEKAANWGGLSSVSRGIGITRRRTTKRRRRARAGLRPPGRHITSRGREFRSLLSLDSLLGPLAAHKQHLYFSRRLMNLALSQIKKGHSNFPTGGRRSERYGGEAGTRILDRHEELSATPSSLQV